jgi:hypothetical protein
MTGNSWFPEPFPKIPTFLSNVDALEVAEVEAQTGTAGAAAARDVKLEVVKHDLVNLQGYVGHIAFLNPSQSTAIIQSAGMTRKLVTLAQKAALAAEMEVGDVILRAKAAGKRAAYEWQYSADGGTTWVTIGTTLVADTRVPGLTPGKTYLFRVRTTVKRTTNGWSQSISFLVH